jgi:integrase
VGSQWGPSILEEIAVKLTPQTLVTLVPPSGQSEAVVFDDDMPGLGLRLRSSGTRTWIYQYKVARRGRRVTIGDAGVISLAKARKTAADLHARVRLGGDPAGERFEERARAADTMATALTAYLEHQRAKLRPRSFAQVSRHLLRHSKPLHSLQLAKIDRRAIAMRLATIAAQAGPVEANRTSASLAAFFAWAIREGIVDGSNPAAGTTRRPERPRDRVLDNAELTAIWAATADDSSYSAIVRLLLLTGQRITEIGALRWSEIVDGRILLPASRTKNDRAHTVPLSAAARAIIDAQPRVDGQDFVFGRGHNRPFTSWSVGKAMLDGRVGAGAAHWTNHDLRRVAATKMADLGISPHIIEAILNHVSGHKRGVAGVYNRANYEPQKRHALDAWAEHLLGIVEGRSVTATVVQLHA